MGVWIETSALNLFCSCIIVTPFVGVWIETLVLLFRVCTRLVTPFVGVWIETLLAVSVVVLVLSHTLRGCVD